MRKTRPRSEVESLCREVDVPKKEVAAVRVERQKWVDLVSTLQTENMKVGG